MIKSPVSIVLNDIVTEHSNEKVYEFTPKESNRLKSAYRREAHLLRMEIISFCVVGYALAKLVWLSL